MIRISLRPITAALLAAFAGVSLAESPAGEAQTLPDVVVKDATYRRAETDGTHSYTTNAVTVAGKVAVPIREVPNSVSVITRQQMDDMGMVTVADALAQAAGVMIVPNDSTQGQYHARGYSLGLMYDGVPAYGTFSGYQQFDLPIYDRVEVLRGPAGLFQGSDNPSGVVNLVRKRPREQFAASAKLSAGTWNNYRAEVDVSEVLNEARTLRGRAVMSVQDRGYFYDRTHDRKEIGYGILEYDLDARTTFSLSGTIQEDVTRVSGNGLPAYANWIYLTVPRSTNVYPDWNRSHWTSQEVSATAEHRFDNQWVAKVRLTRRNQAQYFKDAYPSSGVDSATMTASYARREADYDYQQSGLDMFVSGPFQLLGRSHNLLLGANRDRRWTSYARGTASSISNVSIFDPNSVPEPTVAYTLGGETETIQYGTFGQLRLSLADPLTLILGGRMSDFKTKFHNISPATPTAWSPGANAHMHFTPYGGMVYDLSSEVSVYGSYSDIFMPQTQLTYAGVPVDPRIGRQAELGTKGSFLGGKLNASLAVFRIRDQNKALPDPDPTHPNAYVAAGEAVSKGWEAEVTGRPLPGLDVSASFSNLNTKYLQDSITNTGKPISNWYPRNMLKLWAKYSLAGVGEPGWTVGGGVDAYSRYSGNGTGASLSQSGYAVVNALVGYRFDKHLAVNLNAYNLFDRVYYTSGVRTINTYNGYGEPRSVMLSLHASM